MPLTSLTLRLEAKRYREELLKRIREVACPQCGAKPGAPCVAKGRPGNWTHAWRNNEAKKAGLVKGRWYARFHDPRSRTRTTR